MWTDLTLPDKPVRPARPPATPSSGLLKSLSGRSRPFWGRPGLAPGQHLAAPLWLLPGPLRRTGGLVRLARPASWLDVLAPSDPAASPTAPRRPAVVSQPRSVGQPHAARPSKADRLRIGRFMRPARPSMVTRSASRHHPSRHYGPEERPRCSVWGACIFRRWC